MHLVRQLRVGDPNFSGIVFPLLILYLWGLHKDIQGGVEVSPSSNFTGRHGPEKALKMPQL